MVDQLGRGIVVVAALLGAAAGHARAGQPIREVIVYKDRAQVTRVQQVDCATGKAVFSGLPSTLHRRSLWASLRGGGGTVRGISHEERATGPRREAREVQDRIRRLDDQLVALDAEIAAAGATRAKLDSFRAHMKAVWGLQAAGQRPPVKSWSTAADLLRQRGLASRIRARKASTRKRQLRRQRARLRQQLATIERKRRRTTIAATAHLECTGRATVELSYVVPGATWQMTYQLRTDPRRERVELVLQGVVQQGTGEDWRDVELAVSTANLQRKNTPPSLQVMRVSTHEPRETRKVLARRFEHRRHLDEAAGDAPASGQPAGAKRPDGGEGERPAPPPVGLAMQLTAARQVSVPADGREVTVTLLRKTVRARTRLETVPKLFPFVYRKVALRNPFDVTLLPGPVELYRGQAFLGRARMKLRGAGEPLAFAHGVHKQVQVHRWVKKEKLKGPGTFGSSKELRHRYVMQVGNWTRAAQTVRVRENIPVSQNKQIVVKLGDDATRPTAWNKEDGILTWELEIPPRSKRRITLSYTVTLPKEYVVTGYDRED